MSLINQKQFDKINKTRKIFNKLKSSTEVCFYYANDYTPEVMYRGDIFSWVIKVIQYGGPWIEITLDNNKRISIDIDDIYFDYVELLKRLRRDLSREIRNCEEE